MSNVKPKSPPFLSPPPPFSLILLFLEKIFLPHSYCQIRGTQSPIYKRGGEGVENNEYESRKIEKYLYFGISK